VVDGPARATRRRFRLVQGVRAGPGVRTAPYLRALRTLARPAPGGARARRGAGLAPSCRRGHTDSRVRQPARSMARRVAALLRAPARGSCARARASRARRSGPARSNIAGTLRAFPPRRAASGAGRDPPPARVCAPLRGALRRARRARRARDDSARRPPPRERVLRWQTVAPPRLGDSSVAHPFFSLVVTFRFLEEINKLLPSDPWFARLRDAYLEPWGSGREDTFAVAMRVGKFAHAFAWARQRDALPPEEHPQFDEWYRVVIRRAVAETGGD